MRRRSEAQRGELVATRELELAQHRRHVALDRLHRDPEVAGDLLVGVAARDQAQHLPFPGRELVELRVEHGRCRTGERVEHETGEPRREDGVALVHPPDRVDQLVRRDRLRHVAARAGADRRDHVLGRVADREREELHVGMGRADLADHPRASTRGHVHVDQHDVGVAFADHLDRRIDVGGRAHHVDDVAELRAHAREEQLVVVDKEHTGRVHAGSGPFCIGNTSSTSVPVPGSDRTVARPPARAIRPTME